MQEPAHNQADNLLFVDILCINTRYVYVNLGSCFAIVIWKNHR
jgi:hypothetical protein